MPGFCHHPAMHRRILFLLCHMIMVWALPTFAATPTTPSFVTVFTNGQEGYPAYRIPSLLTTKRGVLLAFAEGRMSLRDHAENDIVLKRSIDGGQTWGALQLVAEDSTNALGNPTAVVVRETGRVL